MVTRRLWLSFCSHSLTNLLCRKPATICELSWRAPHYKELREASSNGHQGTEVLGPTVHEELNPAKWVSVDVAPPSVELQMWQQPWLTPWMLLCEALSQWQLVSCACTPDPYKLWGSVCCKTLGFGEMGDTVVDSEYSLLTGFYLCIHPYLLQSISSKRPMSHFKSENIIVSFPYLNP